MKVGGIAYRSIGVDDDARSVVIIDQTRLPFEFVTLRLQSLEAAIGFALGISAGTFLYISIGDLLPTVHEQDEKKYINLVSLSLGLIVMFFSMDIA